MAENFTVRLMPDISGCSTETKNKKFAVKRRSTCPNLSFIPQQSQRRRSQESRSSDPPDPENQTLPPSSSAGGLCAEDQCSKPEANTQRKRLFKCPKLSLIAKWVLGVSLAILGAMIVGLIVYLTSVSPIYNNETTTIRQNFVPNVTVPDFPREVTRINLFLLFYLHLIFFLV